jgi:hypothetical protein
MEISAGVGTIEGELEKYGTYASITKGVSMRPLFKTARDVIVVVKPDRPLKKYDVVLYIGLTGKYTLHRIIKVCEKEYLIRGDNTYTVEHIPKENVIGLLTEFNRAGKSHKTTDRSFRIYSRVWNFIYPLRSFYRRARGKLSRMCKRKNRNTK